MSEYQKTTCCRCEVYKHTPVRCDDLGGYICGGCLEDAYHDQKTRAVTAETTITELEEERGVLLTGKTL
jgi:hypothetical protein